MSNSELKELCETLRTMCDKTIEALNKESAESPRGLKVGDKVGVVEWGLCCNTATRWLIEHIEDKELLVRYAFQDYKLPCGSGGEKFDVVFVEDNRALISDYSGRCYLFKINGLYILREGQNDF